ncbi:hypothetical protein L8106_12815 [Microseira wollei NIES-4236]|uniref:DUF937 domain-containing protein n=2 Tax=Microseira wollei TaxID=467598 RepID=A0AAV3XR24_9CYAN|nr:hypothetical protein L8106_12815 [Microseira wollei NIES-4236]
MKLFINIINALHNPEQQGSVAQLETIFNRIDQVAAKRGIESAKMEEIMTALGSFLRPLLQHQQRMMGDKQLENLIAQMTDAETTAATIHLLISPQLYQQIVQGISQKTGISANALQGILPTILTAVMGLLYMGTSKPGASCSNSVLSAFVDRDSEFVLGEVLQSTEWFLNRNSGRNQQ